MNEPILNLSTRGSYRTLFDAAVLMGGDDSRVAITFVQTGHDPVSVSRRDFRTKVSRMASVLESHGIQPGDVVIIAHTQDLESIFLFWGALLIGAIPSMFHTVTEKIPAEVYYADLPPLIEHSKARAIYTTDRFADEIGALVDCDVFSSSDLAQDSLEAPQDWQPDPDQTAFLQHSSGTTGAKKGVALSHTAVLNQVASYSEVLGISRQDTVVSWMPLYHDGGLIAGHLMPLIQGLHLVLISPFDWVKHPAILFQSISKYNGTLSWLPNFAYNHCATRTRERDLTGISLATMRAFINAAEPVRVHSHKLFLDRFGSYGIDSGKLTVMYGMAENVLAITQSPPGRTTRVDVVDKRQLEVDGVAVKADPSLVECTSVVSCGPPLPNVQIRIVDDSFTSQPDRRVGEIAIQSDCLFEGYYHRPDLTRASFHEDWHLTGDLGYLAEGELYVAGRKKDLIIHAGKNIYPHDLETIVGQVPGIHPGRVVCFGVEDEKEGTELIAIVAEADAGAQDEIQTIAERVRGAISQQTSVTAAYVDIVNQRWLLKTSSGKISRAANRKKWLRTIGTSH